MHNIPVTTPLLARFLLFGRRASLALLLIVLAFGSFTGCSTAHSHRIAESAAGTKAHFITLSELEKSLPRPPIIAVFDIDDTTLFTSGGFQWGAKHFGNEIVSAGVSVREADLKTDEDKRKFREFWTRMNNELDEYSVPKWIARELIELHKKRGDKIYFVTKRINTGNEHLTPLLKEWFGLPNLEPVIFTQREPNVRLHQHPRAGELRRFGWRYSRLDCRRGAPDSSHARTHLRQPRTDPQRRLWRGRPNQLGILNASTDDLMPGHPVPIFRVAQVYRS